MPYRIAITPKAQRQIGSLPVAIQGRISTAIKGLRENPRPRGSKKLVGSESLYRIRVGDYRIVYAVQDDLLPVTVLTSGHRQEVYRAVLKWTPERIRELVAKALLPDA